MPSNARRHGSFVLTLALLTGCQASSPADALRASLFTLDRQGGPAAAPGQPQAPALMAPAPITPGGVAAPAAELQKVYKIVP